MINYISIMIEKYEEMDILINGWDITEPKGMIENYRLNLFKFKKHLLIFLKRYVIIIT